MHNLSDRASRAAADADSWTPARARLGWYVVGVLLIAWVLAYLDRGIINLLAHGIKRDMGLSDTQLSLVLGLAFSAAFAVGGLPIGYLVDHYNRRNIIIAGCLVWVLATFASGLAYSFGTLFAARMFVGLGEACLAPAAFSIVADYFPPARRGRAMTIMMAGSSLGHAASIFLGGLLLVALSGMTFILPGVGRLTTAQATFMLVALPGVAVALLMLTFREPARAQHGPVGDAAAESAHAARRQPSLSGFALRHRGAFALVFGLMLCNFAVATTAGSWTPLILMRLYGISPGTVGLWLGLIILAVGPLGGYLGGWLADRLSVRYPLNGRLRVALLVCPLLLVMVLGYLSTSLPMVLIAFAGVSGFGNMLVGAGYSALHDMVPAGLRGRVIALLLFVNNMIGVGIGGTLVGLVTDHVFHDDRMVQLSLVMVLAPMALIGLLLSWLAQAPYAGLRSAVLAGTA